MEELLKEENNFSLFKDNKDLIGIVLGYGTTNSILYQNFDEKLQLVSKNLSLNFPYQKVSTDKNQIIQTLKILKVKPSFSYDSIELEIEDLFSNISHHPKVGFTYCKDTNETKKLLIMYEQSQKNIDKILQNPSDKFLSLILEKFCE